MVEQPMTLEDRGLIWTITSNLWGSDVCDLRFFTSLDKANDAALKTIKHLNDSQQRMEDLDISKCENSKGETSVITYSCKYTEDFICVECYIVEE